MGNEDDGLVQFFLKFQQEVLHIGADQRIKSGEGFVHQHHARVGCQRAGNTHTLLHTAGKLVGMAFLKPLKSHSVEPFSCLRNILFIAETSDFQCQGGILNHRFMRQQRKLLKDHRHFLTADASKHLLAALNEVVVTEDDFPCRGLDQPVDVADQSGLA